MKNKIIDVPFDDMAMIKGDNFAFKIIDPNGKIRSIPYHRIKRVFKNEELIWKREIDELKKKQKNKRSRHSSKYR